MKLDFKDKNLYVGIDVHLKSWDVKVLTEHTSQGSPVHMRPANTSRLVAYLNKHYPGGNYHCVYEAGYSGFWLHKELSDLGINTLVVNPADVPTSDRDSRMKSDRTDCIKLAKSLRGGLLRGIYVPSEQQLKDRLIVRQRYQRAKEVRRIKNRIRSHLLFFGITINWDVKSDEIYWSNRKIERLIEYGKQHEDTSLLFEIQVLKEYRKLEAAALIQLRALSKLERHRNKVKWLMSIKGIGVVTAMLIVTEVGPIDRFDKFDKLAAYVGIIPGSRSSGENEKGNTIIKRGNKRLRTALVLSSWIAIRHNSELTLCYEEYRKRNMASQKAIIKIARKLLSRVFFVLKNECELKN